MAQKWSSIKEPWTIKDIGAPLLDTLASGLYGALEILREYAQNAIDSYADYASNTGGESPMRSVQIRIDPDNAALLIHDNGVGMDRADVMNAKSIAVSHKLKRNQEFVGFRGIGIWSGLAACDKLEITTTKVGDAHEYKLEIDCKGIVQNVESPISVDVLLENRFDIFERDAELDEHYTTVKLVNVHRERYADLLDKDKVMRYVGEVLPVPFDPKWEHSSEVSALLKDVAWTQPWDITVDGDPVYRRFPLRQTKAPTIERITIKDGDNDLEVATAWVGETNSLLSRKSLDPDTERGEVVGFAVRVKSFALGERNLYADESVEDRDNLSWFTGEVYITDPDLRPDSNRRALQQTDKSRRAIDAIRKFYAKVATRARGWSEEVLVRKAAADLKDIVSEVEKALDVPPGKKARNLSGKVSKERIEELEDVLQRATQAAERITEARKKSTSSGKSIRESTIKTYLQKPDVKALLTEGEGYFKRVQDLLKMHAPELEKSATTKRASKAKGKAKRASKRGSTKAAGGSGNRGAPDEELVNLETAKAAFLAAVAATVGPNSDAYKRIAARLDEELRRRGIGVKAA